MTKFYLLKEHSKEDHADSIGYYLPNDRTFHAKHTDGTNFRNLLLGLGEQLRKFELTVNTFTNECGPENAFYLMPEWERMLSIPDDCFKNTVSIQSRRNNALIKLARMNSQTALEMEEVADLIGVEVDILAGIDAINPPYSLSIPEITSDHVARFTIVVIYNSDNFGPPDFPLTFPISFGDDLFGTMQCVLRKLKPANCQIIFIDDAP